MDTHLYLVNLLGHSVCLVPLTFEFCVCVSEGMPTPEVSITCTVVIPAQACGLIIGKVACLLCLLRHSLFMLYYTIHFTTPLSLVHVCVHTCMHTYTHTYIHTHIHTQNIGGRADQPAARGDAGQDPGAVQGQGRARSE